MSGKIQHNDTSFSQQEKIYILGNEEHPAIIQATNGVTQGGVLAPTLLSIVSSKVKLLKSESSRSKTKTTRL